jgi:WhiB family redox-sensing transcriptional regulator
MEQSKPIFPYDGECGNYDPELFFPQKSNAFKQIREAKAVCRICPVIDECFEYALNEKEITLGIWGGHTLKEISRLRSRRQLGLGRSATSLQDSQEIA